MIRSFLIVLATLVGTTTCAQDALPQFVRNLSDGDYASWATWQNRQAELRTSEERRASPVEPFIYAVRTTSSASGGVTAATTNNVAIWRNIVTETLPHRYVNTAYRSPKPITINNPYARFANPVDRTPNWDKVFVPCKSGTMTVSEALDKMGGRVPAELLFSRLMSQGWGKP